MTGLDHIPSESFREGSIPVLETERLVLRAPRLGDAKTVAALANDRQIAENTARIPHPYRLADAKDWIAGANKNPDEQHYVITLATRGARRPLDRLLARPGLLGQRLRHRGAARAHRPRFRRPRSRGAAGERARDQSGIAARAGEMRLPVDRRRALPRARDPFLGAGRSLPARARHLGVAQELGKDATGGISCRVTARGAATRKA